MKKLTRGLILLGLLAAFSAAATAQTNTIPYEGRLTAATGARLGQDTATITFSIYSVLTGGSALWSETHDAVPLDNGVFNVQLGTLISFPADLFDGSNLYLEIQARSEVLTPRQPISSVPYAVQAAGWVKSPNVVRLATGTDNVGIGTTGPAANLHIVSSAGATGLFAGGTSLLIDAGDFQRYITMRGPNSGQTGILFSNSESFVDGGLRYFPSATAGSERLDILSGGSIRVAVMGSGNVGIGTTAPAATLHVNGTAGNNTGVWSNLSDRRLKKDIRPIENALELVNRLEGVSFRWKDPQKDAEFGRVRGLIAQDVEKVLPEWVKTDPDGYRRLEPIGVDALLIEAIKQQQKQIEELKEQISKLTVGLQKSYGQK